MQPTLVTTELFGRTVTIHGYGTSIAIGGVLWFVLVRHECRRWQLFDRSGRLLFMLLALLVSAWLGGKAFYVLQFGAPLSSLVDSPGQGFVYYGSLLAALPTYFLLARWWSIPAGVTLDAALAPAPLLHVFGRLGCFLAGCCYGAPSDRPWAVMFQEGVGLNGIELHPVQLYEALGELLLFALLWFVLRPRQTFPGQLALTYLGGYALLRLASHRFRGDEPGELLPGLTVPAPVIVSVLLLTVSTALWIRERRRYRTASSDSASSA